VSPPFADRDHGEIEAFIIDRYLDSLLAGAPAEEASDVPRDLRAAMARLASDLPRFHPSFRFEERLALRLAELGATMRAPMAAGAETVVVPLSGRTGRPPGPGGGGEDPARVQTGRPVATPVVIGGVITSAAISLAGAAFVAWRRGRTPADPMTRALRAVVRGRVN
jgi:hypothetical protein